MKNEWYGDKRDVVKWATIVHLCRQHHFNGVSYVAMLRPGPLRLPALEIDGVQHDLPQEVWSYFRQIDNIHGLAPRAGLRLRIFDSLFQWTQGFRDQQAAREDYFMRAVAFVQAELEPQVVFVDPDTGIEPENVGWEHIRKDELRRLYNALKSGDVLVVYQHQYRSTNWMDTSRSAVAAALGVTKVQSITSAYAADVAFYVARKPSGHGDGGAAA